MAITELVADIARCAGCPGNCNLDVFKSLVQTVPEPIDLNALATKAKVNPAHEGLFRSQEHTGVYYTFYCPLLVPGQPTGKITIRVQEQRTSK
jgi:hypothetical protein